MLKNLSKEILGHCGECLHFTTNPAEGCGLTMVRCTPEEYCSKFTFKNPEGTMSCEICGHLIIPKIMNAVIDTDDEGNLHVLCENCLTKMHTCDTCDKRNSCDFETNPSTIPKVVQKRVQNGPMTMMTQVRNPARIDITCKQNCCCWSEEYGCQKENNYCKQYHHTYTT